MQQCSYDYTIFDATKLIERIGPLCGYVQSDEVGRAS
jgi:hypothetical protein